MLFLRLYIAMKINIWLPNQKGAACKSQLL
jgi:hypothetical protein